MKKLFLSLSVLISLIFLSSNSFPRTYQTSSGHVLIIHEQPTNLGARRRPRPKNDENIPESIFPIIDNNHFELLGFLLPGNTTYKVNKKVSESHMVAIVQSFNTWDNNVTYSLFTYGGRTRKKWYRLDGENTISFVAFYPEDAVALTSVYYSADNFVVDYDIIFNALYNFRTVPNLYTYDLQSIATHEVGHVLGLKDLYEDQYYQLTMYGYADNGIGKRSLEFRDIDGAQFLYGMPWSVYRWFICCF